MPHKIVYDGSYITVHEKDINGHTYELVELRRGIKVYPIKENKVLAIKEYRPQEDKSFWRFIGGWDDKAGKGLQEIAEEEFAEEVGMKSDDWYILYEQDNPGSTVNSNTFFFVAMNPSVLEVKVENPDQEIIEETAWLTLEEVYALLDSQELRWDNGSVGAIQALRRFGSTQV